MTPRFASLVATRSFGRASLSAPKEVAIVNGSTPISPQTLTGGLYLSSYGNGTTGANYSVNGDNIRMAWPSWSDSVIRTNNTFNLTGTTKMTIDYDGSGFNSPYAYFSIAYPNTSGGYVGIQLITPGTQSSRKTQTFTLSQAPGTGQIQFNASNSFSNVYIYSLVFKAE